jgi:hypothetical protein
VSYRVHYTCAQVKKHVYSIVPYVKHLGENNTSYNRILLTSLFSSGVSTHFGNFLIYNIFIGLSHRPKLSYMYDNYIDVFRYVHVVNKRDIFKRHYNSQYCRESTGQQKVSLMSLFKTSSSSTKTST